MNKHWVRQYKITYYKDGRPYRRCFSSCKCLYSFIDELLCKGKVFKVYEYDKDFDDYIEMEDLSNEWE